MDQRSMQAMFAKTVLVGRPRHRPILLMVVGSLLWGLAGHSEPKLYDPDPQACQVERIKSTYQANFLPWQDQPAVVQQRLRQLQAAMTLDTLRDCESKGLLNGQQVNALLQELGLQRSQGSSPEAPGPARSPALP